MSEIADKQLALARHYLAVAQPGRVLDVLGEADIDLEDPDVWSLRAEALYQLDRYEAGAAAARDGLARDPEEISLLDVLALCEAELGHLAAAERALLAALELWPDHPTLLCHYALLCVRGGQAKKARRLLDEASRLAPDSTEVLRVRAQVSYLSGDRRGAARDASELLAAEPEDRMAHVIRGNTLADRDVYRALRHFEHAARLDPSDREIARVTRYNRVLTHPLQWPIWPIQRFGVIRVWVAYIGLIALSSLTGIRWLPPALVGIYLALVVYSWTIAPLARWWMRRGLR
jgi:tetratricopeptide (TPR) repeat protein